MQRCLLGVLFDQCRGVLATGTAACAHAKLFGELLDVLGTGRQSLANLGVADGVADTNVHSALM